MLRSTDDGLKVLVADDHPQNREILRTVLQALEVEPHLVADGAEAVAAAGREHFDLVLTDLAMPGLDGVATIRAIRADERRRGLPRSAIYVFSSQHEPRDLRASRKAGADGHLGKPLRLAELLHALDDSRRGRRGRFLRQTAPAAAVAAGA